MKYTPTKNVYLASPVFDWTFLILSPLIAVGMSFVLRAALPEEGAEVTAWGYSASWWGLLALTQAHLPVVFLRSHGNRRIFKMHPVRFVVVPVLLLTLFLLSDWALAVAAALGIWWDVYHSSQQNFGLGRIYDVRSGNHPDAGRHADQVLFFFLYAAPIFGGAHLMSHVSRLDAMNRVSAAWWAVELPALIEAHARPLRYSTMLLMVAMLSGYLFQLYKHRSNYHFPIQKLALMVSVGLCSLLAWGMDSVGDAYFTVNLYHAVQYFCIVWLFESKGGSALGRLRQRAGWPAALGLFLVLPILFGTWVEFTSSARLPFAVLVTVSLLHFWYDGFIWSVRKRQI